jgi:hypothetical protein
MGQRNIEGKERSRRDRGRQRRDMAVGEIKGCRGGRGRRGDGEGLDRVERKA